MRFAEKLRILREEAGLSEARLARKAGIPFGTLRNYSDGRRSPSFAVVVQIAHALGVTCQEFADCDEFKIEAKADPSAVFAANLIRLRKGQSYNLDDLADAAGLTKRELQALEDGLAQPTWDVVVKLAAAFKVSVSEFSVGTNDDKSKN